MTYGIAGADSPEALAEKVNAMIAESWEPIGGIAVSQTFEPHPEGIAYGSIREIWSQAMTKR